MSRRIEIWVLNDDITPSNPRASLVRIGWYISRACDWSYNIDKGGLFVEGCGMDMIFHVLSTLNYAAAQWEHGDNWREKIAGRVYDDYLFDTRYELL